MPKPIKSPNPPRLERWELFTIAGAAKLDPRTVQDYITGKRRCKTAATREAIERTLRDHNHADLIRAEA